MPPVKLYIAIEILYLARVDCLKGKRCDYLLLGDYQPWFLLRFIVLFAEYDMSLLALQQQPL
jgi:hypothetical protein